MNMFLIYRTSFQHNMVINLLLRPRQLLRRIVMNIHCDEYVSLDKFWHNQDVVYDFKAQLQRTRSRSEGLYEES